MTSEIIVPDQTENETDPDTWLDGLTTAVDQNDGAEWWNVDANSSFQVKQAMTNYVKNNPVDVGVITVRNNISFDAKDINGDPITAYLSAEVTVDKDDPLYYKLATMRLMQLCKDNDIDIDPTI